MRVRRSVPYPEHLRDDRGPSLGVPGAGGIGYITSDGSWSGGNGYENPVLDLGFAFHLDAPAPQAANHAALIAAEQAQMAASESVFQAYSIAHTIDPSEALAAGAAKKTSYGKKG